MKTTIYLPEELKVAVERVAKRRGRTEADVIREAIAREVAEAERAEFPVFRSGKQDAFAERDEEMLAVTGFGRQ